MVKKGFLKTNGLSVLLILGCGFMWRLPCLLHIHLSTAERRMSFLFLLLLAGFQRFQLYYTIVFDEDDPLTTFYSFLRGADSSLFFSLPFYLRPYLVEGRKRCEIVYHSIVLEHIYLLHLTFKCPQTLTYAQLTLLSEPCLFCRIRMYYDHCLSRRLTSSSSSHGGEGHL